MNNFINKLVNRGFSPLEAYGIIRKLAVVDALEQWARTTPPMESEENTGWQSAKGRVLQISQNSQTPEDAAESIRQIIDMVPQPQTGRDRGRLRGLNEALDAMSKGTYDTGATQSPEVPPHGGSTPVPGHNPTPRVDGTDSFTPGGGSQIPRDMAMGTGRMAKKASGENSFSSEPTGADRYKFVRLRGNWFFWDENTFSVEFFVDDPSMGVYDYMLTAPIDEATGYPVYLNAPDSDDFLPAHADVLCYMTNNGFTPADFELTGTNNEDGLHIYADDFDYFEDEQNVASMFDKFKDADSFDTILEDDDEGYVPHTTFYRDDYVGFTMAKKASVEDAKFIVTPDGRLFYRNESDPKADHDVMADEFLFGREEISNSFKGLVMMGEIHGFPFKNYDEDFWFTPEQINQLVELGQELGIDVFDLQANGYHVNGNASMVRDYSLNPISEEDNLEEWYIFHLREDNPEYNHYLKFYRSEFNKDYVVSSLSAFSLNPPLPPRSNIHPRFAVSSTVTAQHISELPPTFDTKALFDLKKYVTLKGEAINWDAFKSSSQTPDEDLQSLLEILTEIGVAETADQNRIGGMFNVDAGRLSELLQREKKADYADEEFGIHFNPSSEEAKTYEKFILHNGHGWFWDCPDYQEPTHDSVLTQLISEGELDFDDAETSVMGRNYGDYIYAYTGLSESEAEKEIRIFYDEPVEIDSMDDAEDASIKTSALDDNIYIAEGTEGWGDKSISAFTEDDEEVATLHWVDLPDTILLEYIAVSPQFQSKGIASSLIEKFLEVAPADKGFSVEPSSRRVQLLIERYLGSPDYVYREKPSNVVDYEEAMNSLPLDSAYSDQEMGSPMDGVFYAFVWDSPTMSINSSGAASYKDNTIVGNNIGWQNENIRRYQDGDYVFKDAQTTDGKAQEDYAVSFDASEITAGVVTNTDGSFYFEEDPLSEISNILLSDDGKLYIWDDVKDTEFDRNTNHHGNAFISILYPNTSLEEIAEDLGTNIEWLSEEWNAGATRLRNIATSKGWMIGMYADGEISLINPKKDINQNQINGLLPLIDAGVFSIRVYTPSVDEEEGEEIIDLVKPSNDKLSILHFQKFAERSDVERKADKIYNSGGIEFVSATPDEERQKMLWEFNVTSTTGERYPLYGDTTMDNPTSWIDWFDVACSCDWGRWNYDRAPEYRHLERFPCSHSMATEKWLSVNGAREQQRARDAQPATPAAPASPASARSAPATPPTPSATPAQAPATPATPPAAAMPSARPQQGLAPASQGADARPSAAPAKPARPAATQNAEQAEPPPPPEPTVVRPVFREQVLRPRQPLGQ